MGQRHVLVTPRARRVMAPRGSRECRGSRPQAGTGARLRLSDPVAPGVALQRLGGWHHPSLTLPYGVRLICGIFKSS